VIINLFWIIDNPFRHIQSSHINANTPDTHEVFNTILERDFKTYFSNRINKDISIHYEFLRNKPTQSGVGDIKFYLWVNIFSLGKLINSGAIKISVINKTRVEVLNFIPKKQIIDKPSLIEDKFPLILSDKIRLKAGINKI